MNKKTLYIALCTLLLSVMIVSCREKGDTVHEPVPVKRELTLTLEPGKWIYYNISDSTGMGSSDIGDAEQDAEWRDRIDWDIALSESGIRTNSGTSGRGNGGLALITDSIYDLKKESSLMRLDYKADTLDVTVIKPLKE